MGPNLELFQTFLELEYKPGKRSSRVTDMPLGSFILLRSEWSGYTVHYIFEGSRLHIPWAWIDLFRGLYIYASDKIMFKDPDPDDYYEQFIRVATELQTYHLGVYSKINGEQYLSTLGDLCILGTKKFRETFSELSLGPFEYSSIDKNFEI